MLKRLYSVVFGLAIGIAILCALSDVSSAQYGPPSQFYSGASVGFQPLAKTSQLAATTSTTTIALATPSFPVTQVQVYNASTAVAFVSFCTQSSGCTASSGGAGLATADYPIGPGAVIVVTVPANSTFVAGILSTGSGAVYFTPGIGL